MDNYQLFRNLLNDFSIRKFEEGNKPVKTFFDIAGFPHYENVMSRVLQFFFDTKGEHGFGDLWIKSLIEAYNEVSGKSIDCGSLETSGEVEREYSNGNIKRIDLLVPCNSLIVVIENKIEADVSYNPLDKYNESAINYAKDKEIKNPTFVYIVLSVFPQNRKDNDFFNVTYDDLFKYVEKNWQIENPDNRWAVLAKDFIENIKNRKGRVNMKLDKEWMNFVEEKGKDISDLLDKYNEDLGQRLHILYEIDDVFDDNYRNYHHGVYKTGSVYNSQFMDIRINGITVCIETYLMIKKTGKPFEDFDKLYISVWTRKNKDSDFSSYLKCLGVEETAKEHRTSGAGAWGKHYFIRS